MTTASATQPPNQRPTSEPPALNLSDSTDRLHLRIFHFNDCYDVINLPKVKSLVDSLRLTEEPGHRNMLIMAGDFLAPSVLSVLDEGACMIDCMNQLGFDFVTIGNHETDVSHAAFVSRVKESNFPWLNTNIINFQPDVPPMPETLSFEISNSRGHARKIGFMGLLLNDPAFYKASSFGGAKILPVIDTAIKTLDELSKTVDTVIPVTHQFMPADRMFAQLLNGRVPLILGGHDHSPFRELVAGCHIIKAGMDAQNVSVTDLIWQDRRETFPDITTQLISVAKFSPDKPLQIKIEQHMHRLLSASKAVQICHIDHKYLPLSSIDVREHQTTIGNFLLDGMRIGMVSDCCILPSGSIRRSYDYTLNDEDKVFTFCDLISELPFQDYIVVVKLSGQVINDAVAESRKRKRTGAYMQIDSRMTYDNTACCITHINNEPIDINKLYRTAVTAITLDGVDEIAPLIEWRRDAGGGPLSPKPIPKEGSVDRLLHKSAILRGLARTVIEEHIEPDVCHEGIDMQRLKSLFSDKPDWFMSTIMEILDLDGDGKIGLNDLIVICLSKWFSEEDAMNVQTLTTRLRSKFGDSVAVKIIASLLDSICDKDTHNHLISRTHVMDWIIKLKYHMIAF